MIQTIGEIVEVTTTSFVAQCLENPKHEAPRLFDPPAFGGFVRVGQNVATEAAPPILRLSDDEDDPFVVRPERVELPLAPNQTYALVCHASVSSLPPGRRPSALGLDDEDELLVRHPQLSELLRTEFSAMLVAFTDGAGRVRCHLPPRPPRIHARVYPCTDDEIKALTRDLSFLRWVINPSGSTLCQAPPEELAAACLRAAVDVRPPESYDFLEQAGRTLLTLLGDDYQRLKAIFDRVVYS